MSYFLRFFCRIHLKAQESERIKLINLKDLYENKEIEWNKQSSEMRVQLIELRESSVSHSLNLRGIEIKNDNVFNYHLFFNRRSSSGKM